MNFKNLFPVLLSVLKDWRVIVTVVAMFIVIKIAKYITNYVKKPRRRKNKKNKVIAAAPAPAPQTEGTEQTEATEEA